jgi:glutamine amidotransferase
MIAIIDYGMGNIHSVQKALQAMGAATLVTQKAQDLRAADKIALPGVGAFADAMQELQKRDLLEAIKEKVNSGKPFLGICLGMQLLFEASEEGAGAKGLGLLKGKVVKFAGAGLKVPHMGWNQIKKCKMQNEKLKNECPLLSGVEDGAYVYFCHSYYPQPEDKSIIAAVTDYGGDFASLVWKENVFGAQFHPEKSQDVGLKIIKNFVEC